MKHFFKQKEVKCVKTKTTDRFLQTIIIVPDPNSKKTMSGTTTAATGTSSESSAWTSSTDEWGVDILISSVNIGLIICVAPVDEADDTFIVILAVTVVTDDLAINVVEYVAPEDVADVTVNDWVESSVVSGEVVQLTAEFWLGVALDDSVAAYKNNKFDYETQF